MVHWEYGGKTKDWKSYRNSYCWYLWFIDMEYTNSVEFFSLTTILEENYKKISIHSNLLIKVIRFLKTYQNDHSFKLSMFSNHLFYNYFRILTVCGSLKMALASLFFIKNGSYKTSGMTSPEEPEPEPEPRWSSIKQVVNLNLTLIWSTGSL